MICVREGVKKARLFRGHVPYQGGGYGWVDHLSFIIVDFFQTKCKKYSVCPEKNLLYSNNFLYCHSYHRVQVLIKY